MVWAWTVIDRVYRLKLTFFPNKQLKSEIQSHLTFTGRNYKTNRYRQSHNCNPKHSKPIIHRQDTHTFTKQPICSKVSPPGQIKTNNCRRQSCARCALPPATVSRSVAQQTRLQVACSPRPRLLDRVSAKYKVHTNTPQNNQCNFPANNHAYKHSRNNQMVMPS